MLSADPGYGRRSHWVVVYDSKTCFLANMPPLLSARDVSATRKQTKKLLVRQRLHHTAGGDIRRPHEPKKTVRAADGTTN